jgi:4-alpha-glucanotransferase
VGPTGGHHSPYSETLSAFAGDPNLISLENLVTAGLLPADILDALPKIQKRHLDFEAVAESKGKLLRMAWKAMKDSASDDLAAEHQAFLQDPSIQPWLSDWALFAALRDRYEGAPWWTWDEPLRKRNPDALNESREQLADEVAYHGFLQFLFQWQWDNLTARAGQLGIELYGDLPYSVARDSADVWAYGELFTVNRNGDLLAQAGHAVSDLHPVGLATGQPLFRWARMEASGFRWWLERLRRTTSLFHRVRLLDLGDYAAAWKLAPEARTAEEGEWLDGPGLVLFESVYRELGPPPILGRMEEPLTPLRFALDEALDIPPTRDLFRAFNHLDAKDVPHRLEKSAVVFVGGPEGPSFQVWYRSLDKEARTRALDYFGKSPGTLEWEMVRAAYTSVASTAIVLLHDLIPPSSETAEEPEGWNWRLAQRHLSSGLARRLQRLAEITARLPGVDRDSHEGNSPLDSS